MGTVASLPQILVANPQFPANSVAELIALAKAKPGTLAYASVGVGSPGHLAGELFKLRTGTQMTHVPYRGGGPAVTDVMGGQVPLLWVSIPAAAQFVKTGKLKALGVSTLKRSAAFPDVPTLQEAGVPDFEVDSWYAMFVPAKTPQGRDRQAQPRAQRRRCRTRRSARSCWRRAARRWAARPRRLGQTVNVGTRQMGQAGQGRQHQGGMR